MELFRRPLTFLVILGESIALLAKNASLLALLSFSTLLLHSALSFFFTRSLPTFPVDPNSFLFDIPASVSAASAFSPAAPKFDFPDSHFRRDILTILAFLLAFSAVSFFSTLSTVVISSMSYNSRTLSLTAFLAALFRSSAALFITSLYAIALIVGYFVILAAISFPLLIYLNFNTLPIILISIFNLLLFLYLLVPLALSLIVSVIEPNCRGIEALGKAAALVNGVTPHAHAHAVFLNICFNALVFGVFQICQTVVNHRKGSSLIRTVLEITAADTAFLVKIFMDIVYTVLYFHCKKDHGEEIELHGSVQYSKLLPTTVLTVGLDDDEEDLD